MKIREVLERYGVKPRKRLGQNFLVNKGIRKKILEAGEFEREDLVIEVGPGLGFLTEELVKKAKKVIAFEIDPVFCQILKERFSSSQNLIVINQDFLEADLFSFPSFKIFGNLPYYITTPLLFKILKEKDRLNLAVVMVQKEVAGRILSSPGNKEYGVLTLSLQFSSSISKIADVSPGSFFPSPGVSSTILQIRPRRKPPVEVGDENLLFKIIQVTFQQRRKTILSSLSRSFKQKKKDLIIKLKDIGIDPKARPETLSLLEFAKLSDLFL